MPPGRNHPCPCGSGKKYKKCCLPREESAAVIESGWLRIRRTEAELDDALGAHLVRHYGPGAVDEAWDEYTLWPEPPAEPDEWPEHGTSFQSWLLYDWEPEQFPEDGGDPRPAISVARHHAEQEGRYLDSYRRRFIEAVCSEPTTFYLVVAAVPGREITLRDIFRQREVTVREHEASRMLRGGEILYTRVVSLDGQAVMIGCAPYLIPSRYFDAVVALRENIAEHQDLETATLRDLDLELRELYLDLRTHMLDPAPPVLRNTEGDLIQLTRMEYALECSAQDAFAALLPLAPDHTPEDLEHDIERDPAGILVRARVPWLGAGGEAPGNEPPSTVLGFLDIRADRMAVEVNSQARADAIKAEIEDRLGQRARLMSTVIESLEQKLAEAAAAGGSSSSELQQAPEIQAMLARMNDEHWRTWPDIPLPALGGQTPREAAATPAGRERLEVLLLDFAAKDDAPGAMRPDIPALRRELGL